jgi:hypothetical protein
VSVHPHFRIFGKLSKDLQLAVGKQSYGRVYLGQDCGDTSLVEIILPDLPTGNAENHICHRITIVSRAAG